MPREVLTLQFGSFANYVGAHYWNFQDELLGLQAQQDGRGPAAQVDCDVLFRQGETATGEGTFTPRLVLWDLSGALGGVSAGGSLYRDSISGGGSGAVVSTWAGGQEVHRARPVSKSAFTAELEAEAEAEDWEEQGGADAAAAGPSPLEAAAWQLDAGPSGSGSSSSGGRVRYWTDFLKAHLHPRSVQQLAGAWHGLTPFGGWGDGGDHWRSEEQREEMMERIRFFAEECDSLQGFQVLADDLSGFGQLAAHVLQELRDDYGSSLPVMLYTLHPQAPLYAQPAAAAESAPAEARRQRLNEGLSLALLAQQCSTYTVVAPPAAAAALPALRWQPGNAYHTSGLCAAALDTATLPYRLATRDGPAGAIGHCDMWGLTHLLTAQYHSPLAALSLALPCAGLPVDTQRLAQQADARLQRGAGSSSASAPAAPAAVAAAAPGSGTNTDPVTSRWLASLTPGIPAAGDSARFAEAVVLRGPRSSAAAPVELGAAAAALDAALAEERLRCVRQRTLVAQPLAVPLPFPHIFAQGLSKDGDVLPGAQLGGSSSGSQDIASCAALTRLAATRAFAPVVAAAARQFRTAAGSAQGQATLEAWGLGREERAEAEEALERLAHAYEEEEAAPPALRAAAAWAPPPPPPVLPAHIGAVEVIAAQAEAAELRIALQQALDSEAAASSRALGAELHPAELEQQLLQGQGTAAALEASLASMQQQLAVAQQQAALQAASEQRAQRLEAELERAAADRAAVQRQADAAHAEAAAAQQQLRDAQEQAKRAGECSRLVVEHAARQAEERGRLEDGARRLEALLAAKEREAQQAAELQREQGRTIQELQDRLCELNERLAASEEGRGCAMDEARDAKGLQCQVADRDRRAAELSQAVSERDEVLAALRRQVKDMCTLAAALKEQGAQQAASLERLERGAVASAAEAASLRGELKAAHQELQAAQQTARKLQATEGQLAQLRGSHSKLQAVHGALQAAHSQQGARLSAAQQRLRDLLAGQEGLAAATAAARQEAEQLQGEVAAARQQLQSSAREAATFRGRFQAVQAANDSLRVQILATGGVVSGTAGGTASKKAPPGLEVPPLRSPRCTAGCSGPTYSPGCHATAAGAAFATEYKAASACRTSSLDSEIGATIPAVAYASPRASPCSPRHTPWPPMAPTGELSLSGLSGSRLGARKFVKGSARLPVAPHRAARRPGRALAGGPSCAAAVDVGAFTAAPADHDAALEAAAASPRRAKDPAAPLARLGALVSAAAAALVPLLHGLASAIVTAALRSQAAPAAAAPAAHAMGASILPGAGRQLQAGTGRMMVWRGAAPAQLDVGQQYEHQQQHKPQLDLLSILLAPAAPLLAPRHARKAAAADSGEGSLSSGSAGSASHAVSNSAAVEASHVMGGSSESGGAGHLEDLLLRLQAAAAAPHVHSDPQFDAVRALLAAAPAAGEPRRNFALSLVDGMSGAEEGDTGIFGQAALLLELSLEEGQPQPQQAQPQQAQPQQAQLQAPAGGDQLEHMLATLTAAAAAPAVQADPRFEAVRALLAVAPPAGEPRRNFARSLVDGMATAEEGDTGIFGQAALLLELSLEEGQPQLQQPQQVQPQPQQPQLQAPAGGDQVERMLATLTAAAAAPAVQADPRFEAVRALLAVAPPAGEPRRNFARSLLDGVAAADDDDTGVFGAARSLLEQALEWEEADLTSSAAVASPAAGQYEQLLQALAAAAATTQDVRFVPVQALLAAAPADAPARHNFARSLLDGIAAADEQDDASSVFGLAGLLLERALEDGSLAPAALAPAAAAPAPAAVRSASPAVTSSSAAAAGSLQPVKPVEEAAAVGKYDGLRLMLRQATVEQDWGEPAKFDPFPALAGWAAAPTLTRWQQYALAGEYDRYDPVAQLLQAAKQATSRPAPYSKYCPVSALLSLLRGQRQGSAAAEAPAAPAPLADAMASSGEDETADQSSRLLAALTRAAAEPGMQLTRQYDGIRALLAAAPPPGEARANFVRSLLDGVAAATEAGDATSVFGQGRVLFEIALEEDPGLLRAAADKYQWLLDALAAEAEADPRFAPVRALLAAAPPARDARCTFALSLLEGIAAAQEQDDTASVFGLAGLLLDSALDADPSLLEDDEPTAAALAAAPAAAPATYAGTSLAETALFSNKAAPQV
ncbi:tubulin nucleotide-binding domain [Chlorella sorokiniana]|uniref:Tubulin nucleotide-binding domain n=1 Tax=Chlorella sorokiniana TaxID=3076 RepID=A0A2P6U0R0_CHLSO|nr:tubulin nucleotide-binding domain [Chlorella sorokiniana]|eukprot:PRW59896.1 tubulin nucleotide-binding domain [Chlorella sorokiniana]